jgi:hypothetical protein
LIRPDAPGFMRNVALQGLNIKVGVTYLFMFVPLNYPAERNIITFFRILLSELQSSQLQPMFWLFCP